MRVLEFTLIGIVLSFSFIINFYYGHQGLMPLDDLQNFNSGHRIITGDFPFRDYYSITGPILDIWQGNIYKILGVSWQSFIFHASVMNSFYALSVFLFLKRFDLKIIHCFFYSISAGLLMYTPSGNPTVEHNSLILSLIATFFFIIAIKEKKYFYLFISTFIFFISFFTKQVPTSYFIIFCAVIYFSQIISKFEFLSLIYIFISSILASLTFLFYFQINGVSIESIFNQYFLIAINLGENRFENLNFYFVYENISKLFFLLFLIIPFFYLSVITKKYKGSILILGLSLLISFYEIHSNNQPITFSLLPIFISLFYYFYSKENLNSNFIKFFLILIIFYAFYRILRYETFYIFIFFTILIFLFLNKKTSVTNLLLIYLFITSCFYYEKYIKIRAWDDLKKNDLDNSFDAGVIDKKLKFLKWKTVNFENTIDEKKMILSTLDYLENLDENTNYILISNYQIYNPILKRKDFSPVKYWFENATYPPKNHNLRDDFERFFKSKIIQNNISQIIIDNTAKFKSEELTEFVWLSYCLEKKVNFTQKKYLEVFNIKNNCVK